MGDVLVVPAGVSGVVRKPKTASPVPLRVRSRVRMAPIPVRADDRAPPERWQHGQDYEAPVAPRMPSNVMHGVQLLRRSGEIGDAEVSAADRFAADYLFGIEGVREASLALRSGAGDVHDWMIARSDAVSRYHEIADAIGPKMTAWLVSLTVEDLSFVAMQQRYMPGPLAGRTEMRGRMTVVLMLLARMYQAIDRRAKAPSR